MSESLRMSHCLLIDVVFVEVIVMLVPCEGSETYVNGKRVEDSIQLRSGTYLIFVVVNLMVVYNIIEVRQN